MKNPRLAEEEFVEANDEKARRVREILDAYLIKVPTSAQWPPSRRIRVRGVEIHYKVRCCYFSRVSRDGLTFSDGGYEDFVRAVQLSRFRPKGLIWKWMRSLYRSSLKLHGIAELRPSLSTTTIEGLVKSHFQHPSVVTASAECTLQEVNALLQMRLARSRCCRRHTSTTHRILGGGALRALPPRIDRHLCFYTVWRGLRLAGTR